MLSFSRYPGIKRYVVGGKIYSCIEQCGGSLIQHIYLSTYRNEGMSLTSHYGVSFTGVVHLDGCQSIFNVAL